jgi:RNA polymerase sigma-70 factor, ECF subfamily
VALAYDLGLCAPMLCRYARALIAGRPGPSGVADDLVRMVLLRTLEAGTASRLGNRDLHLHLYTLLIECNRERVAAGRLGVKAQVEGESIHFAGSHAAARLPASVIPYGSFGRSLLGLTLEEREALLLVVLEGFSYAQTARILKISQRVLIARLARARAALGEAPAGFLSRRRAKPCPSYLRVIK